MVCNVNLHPYLWIDDHAPIHDNHPTLETHWVAGSHWILSCTDAFRHPLVMPSRGTDPTMHSLGTKKCCASMECYAAIAQKLAELCCDLELGFWDAEICSNMQQCQKWSKRCDWFVVLCRARVLADTEELRAISQKKSRFPKIETWLLTKQSSKKSCLCWTNTESSLTESTTHMHPLDSTLGGRVVLSMEISMLSQELSNREVFVQHAERSTKFSDTYWTVLRLSKANKMWAFYSRILRCSTSSPVKILKKQLWQSFQSIGRVLCMWPRTSNSSQHMNHLSPVTCLSWFHLPQLFNTCWTRLRSTLGIVQSQTQTSLLVTSPSWLWNQYSTLVHTGGLVKMQAFDVSLVCRSFWAKSKQCLLCLRTFWAKDWIDVPSL